MDESIHWVLHHGPQQFPVFPWKKRGVLLLLASRTLQGSDNIEPYNPNMSIYSRAVAVRSGPVTKEAPTRADLLGTWTRALKCRLEALISTHCS